VVYAIYLLIFDQFGDTGDEFGLVDHVGYLRHHDFLAGAIRFNFSPGSHDDTATTRFKGILDTGIPINEAAGGKIGGQHILHQLRHLDGIVVDVGNQTVYDLGEVMGCHVGRHTHGDAGGTVNQEVGNTGRQHGRFLECFIEVGLHIYRLFLNIDQHFFSQAFEPAFGIPHGSRRITVHRTEVTLAIDHGITHGPFLRHAHHGIIDGRVTVRMVLTQYVTHNTSRFLIRFI